MWFGFTAVCVCVDDDSSFKNGETNEKKKVKRANTQRIETKRQWPDRIRRIANRLSIYSFMCDDTIFNFISCVFLHIWSHFDLFFCLRRIKKIIVRLNRVYLSLDYLSSSYLSTILHSMRSHYVFPSKCCQLHAVTFIWCRAGDAELKQCALNWTERVEHCAVMSAFIVRTRWLNMI